MTDIYCLFKIGRVLRSTQPNGTAAYVPALPESIEVSGQTYSTDLVFEETNRFGWRRFDMLATWGMVCELGQVGATSDYLYIAVLPEDRANVLRHFTVGIETWTLREFLCGFPDYSSSSSSSSSSPWDEPLLDQELIDAWPDKWYTVGDDGEYDYTKPMVRMAPARARGLINAGVEAEEEHEWLTGSTVGDAETLVQQKGTPA